MTFIFEIAAPPQWKPGRYTSRSMVRVWWLWFAVGYLRIPFREFTETAFDWKRS